MLISDLPDDILYIIIKKCNIGKQRQITIINNVFYNDELYKKIQNEIFVKTSRIKLWLKILLQKQKLFRDINLALNRHFTLNFGRSLEYNKCCLLFSPHVQYGPCRFCMKLFNEHKYFKMINIYLELTTKTSN